MSGVMIVFTILIVYLVHTVIFWADVRNVELHESKGKRKRFV